MVMGIALILYFFLPSGGRFFCTFIYAYTNFPLVSKRSLSTFSSLESPAQKDSYILQRVGSKKEQSQRFRESIHGYGNAERITGIFRVLSFLYSRFLNGGLRIIPFMLTRNQEGNANFVKKSLSTQQPNLSSSGGKNVNDENFYVIIQARLSFFGWSYQEVR